MRNFRNWEMYINSKVLVKEVYILTADFPDSEKFGLISQLRRAAVSISANIAEGAGRQTDKDFRNFLFIALGSAFEV
jgi:four helix bundle protein